MKSTDLLASLDILLDRLVIGPSAETANPRAEQYQAFAFSRVATILRVDENEKQRQRFELRLRLALHLSPVSAIAYAHDNPIPRWQLIRDHLINELGRDLRECETLAREIATVLDNWDQVRAQVTGHRTFLLRRDGPFCQNCHVQFGVQTKTLLNRDPYKPYFESPEELMSIEVDHIEAVSALGTNFVKNLQLLCRLCNAGKGDGLGLDVRQEARFAGFQVSNVPLTHRSRLLYTVIERDHRSCVLCNNDETELTIRKVLSVGAYIRSNLYTVCVDCAPDPTV